MYAKIAPATITPTYSIQCASNPKERYSAKVPISASAVTPAQATEPCAAKFARPPTVRPTSDQTEIHAPIATQMPTAGNTSNAFSSRLTVWIQALQTTRAISAAAVTANASG